MQNLQNLHIRYWHLRELVWELIYLNLVLTNSYQSSVETLIRRADFPLALKTTNKICNCCLSTLRGIQFWTAEEMHTSFQDEYKLLPFLKQPSVFVLWPISISLTGKLHAEYSKMWGFYYFFSLKGLKADLAFVG